MQSNRISVLILHDSKNRSCLSIEPSGQHDGSCRLFREFAGSGFPTDKELLDRLDEFLNSNNARITWFEDTRKGIVQKLLKKVGYKRIKPYDFPSDVRVKWRQWNDALSPGQQYFGVSMDAVLSFDQKIRRMQVSDKHDSVGEIAFTDYGRFARAKANQIGSEGYGRISPGKNPSVILLALVKEMLNEGKRYLILGPEYREFASPIHYYPLWHMTFSGQRSYDHSCRRATESDHKVLFELTSQYENLDYSNARATVTKNLSNPAFQYLVTPGGEGFALVKFMENAEGMINDLFVSPASQGKGMGDELTRGSISRLSESCINIHLNTIYPRAKRLYEKYGFRVSYEDLCIALNQRAMIRQ